MAKDFSKSFYNSAKWKKCRALYLSTHAYCERCLQMNVLTIAEHVHHIVYINESNVNDPSVTLNFDNLEALCQTCHNKEHMSKSEVNDDLYFNADGNLVQKPVKKHTGGVIVIFCCIHRDRFALFFVPRTEAL